MDNAAIRFRRLASQQLSASRLQSVEEVVGWLGAVQAQDYAMGKWTVGLRCPGLRDADVEAALRGRRILRTWTLRGTLHFVCPRDIRWMLDLLGPVVIAGSARRYRELELDEATLARGVEIIARALEGGEELLRPQLLEILRGAGISTQGQRAPYLLARAALAGRAVQVGVVRNEPLYRTMLGVGEEGPRLTREEGAAVLARRYFASHGPATRQDFTTWSGLPTALTRSGLETVQSELASEDFAKQTYYWGAAPLVGWNESQLSPQAHLLPPYDEFLMGYSERSAMLDPQDAAAVALSNGFSPTFALDGRIAGTWKRVFLKDKVRVTPAPFHPLDEQGEQALQAAVQSFGAFLEMPLN